MRTRRVELKAEVDVMFSDPKKIVDYFIDCDWGYSYSDLDELTNHLALMFQQEEDVYHQGECSVSIEGYPPFHKRGQYYIAYGFEMGYIIITYNQRLVTSFYPEPIQDSEVKNHKLELDKIGVYYDR